MSVTINLISFFLSSLSFFFPSFHFVLLNQLFFDECISSVIFCCPVHFIVSFVVCEIVFQLVLLLLLLFLFNPYFSVKFISYESFGKYIYIIHSFPVFYSQPPFFYLSLLNRLKMKSIYMFETIICALNSLAI